MKTPTDPLSQSLALAERLRGTPVPPLSWYAPINTANGHVFRTDNLSMVRLVHELIGNSTWEEAGIAVNAVLLAQLRPLERAGLQRSDTRTRAVFAALLPGLWSLHAAGPRPEHDLWSVIDRLQYARSESGAENVLRQIVGGTAHVARKVARLRAYADFALDVRAQQGSLFGHAPPPAEDLYRRVLAEEE